LIKSYRRLGLAARPLNLYTSGGVEKAQHTKESATGVSTIKPKRAEGIIKRNPDGTTSIVYPDDDEDEETMPVQPMLQGETSVVKELLGLAAQPTIPNRRRASTLEAQWLQQLVDKYGEDYDQMMWNRDLNPMQHTPAQLKRKIKKWRETTHR